MLPELKEKIERLINVFLKIAILNRELAAMALNDNDPTTSAYRSGRGSVANMAAQAFKHLLNGTDDTNLTEEAIEELERDIINKMADRIDKLAEASDDILACIEKIKEKAKGPLN